MKQRMNARERFRTDYQLALIVLVAATAAIFVTPFAVFRFLEGTYSVAIADALIVVGAAAAAVYAWWTGKTYVPGIIIALILATGVIVVTAVIRLDGAFWVYPVVMFIFYIAPPKAALGLAAVALAAIAGFDIADPGSVFTAPNQKASFLVSATTAMIFSFVFARHSNRQRRMLVRWATRDPLTGLYNRRHLDEELRIALASRIRHDVGYGLIILDLDNFKQINDEEGHAAGDQVLRDLAALIRQHTRVGDRAFRYGGDEFVILLPNTDGAGLKTMARNLITAIAANLRCNGRQVTASLGAALLLPEDDADMWNRRADRCLYTAKERGRNTAVVDTGDGNA